MRFTACAFVAVCLAGVACTRARADPLTVTTSNGPGLQATAVFDTAMYAGVDYLTITLTNSSLDDLNLPSQVLTGLYFDIAGSPTLTPAASGAAMLVTGSTFQYASTLTGGHSDGDVSGEWAYATWGGATGPAGAAYGLGAAGYSPASWFGAADLMPGADRNNHQGPNGLDFGLLSAGWDAAGDNGGLDNNGPLIQGGVFFRLSYSLGTGGALNPLDQITGVGFLYGTSSDENFSVPEPTTLALFGLGAGALALRRRRRKLA